MDRLDLVESELAITRLINDYCHGFDKRDWPRFEAVWHEDATWHIARDVEVVGAAAILERARKMWLENDLQQSHHHSANVVIAIDGESATGLIDARADVQERNGAWSHALGTYEDRYERRDGRWKIARREATERWVDFEE